MKQSIFFLTLFVIVLILTGCGPSEKNYTLSERRQIIDDMADQNLQRLYLERPSARQEIAEAAGYGVFSNANVYILFASAGGGYGVAVDKTTGVKTYMKSGSGGVGVGIGAKDYRQVIIFKSRQAFLDFVGGGWDLGGQADATAKTSETGGAVAADGRISREVIVYTLTEAGLSLQATVSGSRYWVDDVLNQPSF